MLLSLEKRANMVRYSHRCCLRIKNTFAKMLNAPLSNSVTTDFLKRAPFGLCGSLVSPNFHRTSTRLLLGCTLSLPQSASEEWTRLSASNFIVSINRGSEARQVEIIV